MNEKTNIEVFNRMGKLVLTDVLYDEKSFDLSNFPDGEYIIRGSINGQAAIRTIMLSR